MSSTELIIVAEKQLYWVLITLITAIIITIIIIIIMIIIIIIMIIIIVIMIIIMIVLVIALSTAMVKSEEIVMEQLEPFGEITIFIGPNWQHPPY